MVQAYLHDCGSVTYYDEAELPNTRPEYGSSVVIVCDGCDMNIVVSRARSDSKGLLPPQHQ